MPENTPGTNLNSAHERSRAALPPAELCDCREWEVRGPADAHPSGHHAACGHLIGYIVHLAADACRQNPDFAAEAGLIALPEHPERSTPEEPIYVAEPVGAIYAGPHGQKRRVLALLAPHGVLLQIPKQLVDEGFVIISDGTSVENLPGSNPIGSARETQQPVRLVGLGREPQPRAEAPLRERGPRRRTI